MAPFLWAFFISSTLLYGHSAVAAISLEAAYEESKTIDYVVIYDAAVVYLDMEDVNNVTTKQIRLENEKLVVNSTNNCSDIVQNWGIPWDVGNSSMRFNNDTAYVSVSGNLPTSTTGLSVSLWVKKFNTTATGYCDICRVEVNDNSGNDNEQRSFQLRKRAIIPDSDLEVDAYDLVINDAQTLTMTLQRTWDWNMISFTINETFVCLFENGVNLQDVTEISQSWEESCVDIGLLLMGEGKDVVALYLNSPDGCQGVEVDEVAMWSRALNIAELIALRVQPFNSTCDFNFTTTTPSPEDILTEFKNAPPQQASQQLQTFANATSNTSPTANDVNLMVDVLNVSQTRGLLNDSSLDPGTRKDNRQAYLEIANLIVVIADEDPEVAEVVQIDQLMEGVEETLGDIYFYSDVTNETIVTENIYLAYMKFSDDHKDLDKIYKVPSKELELVIPKENFKGDEQEMVVMVYSKNLNTLVITENSDEEPILTEILSIQLPETRNKNLLAPIEISFGVTTTNLNELKGDKELVPYCKYLNLDIPAWLIDGVETNSPDSTDTNKLDIVCTVSHLTNFAVLMSPVELEENPTLSALTYVLLIISIICLLITFVVLMCLREIGSTQRVQILKQFIFALMMAQLLFVVTSELFVGQPVLCKLAAALSHYFWLSAFTWMLVQGVQLYTKVRRLVGGNIKQLFYILFAWGFPLPIAIIPLIIMFAGDMQLSVCSLHPDLIWFFAVPVVLVFCVNLMVTVLVMKTFLTVKVNKDKTDTEKLKSSMRAVIVMVPVLGLTWAFGFLILVQPTVIMFHYLFVIFNCLQGVFVFLLHLVLNEDVRSALLKRRNKVAASAENTIFTKLPRNKNSESGTNTTDTSKAPLPSDSTNM